MTQLEQKLKEKGINIVGSAKIKIPKTSIGRELINNLVYRLNRRGNTMIEMKGHYVDKVRIDLSGSFFDPKNKGLSIWAHPFPRGKYLMLKVLEPAMLAGEELRASDVFGNGINIVRL
jgi:hypothetical protein|tara:strand:- start:1112 stop:1465 length:354 start_codon:yes stop_codon:yes gene_type:complete